MEDGSFTLRELAELIHAAPDHTAEWYALHFKAPAERVQRALEALVAAGIIDKNVTDPGKLS